MVARLVPLAIARLRFGVYRRALVEELGGLRVEFAGSRAYDLVLRLSERDRADSHIPRMLYHWRKPAARPRGSRAPGPTFAGCRAGHRRSARRRGEPGRLPSAPIAGCTWCAMRSATPNGRVIVPTRDRGEDVERCLSSLFAKAGYKDLEVILLDNGSTEKASLATFERWAKKEPRVRVVRYNVPFNFSRINNYAVSKSTGHYVLFLNNDTEAKSAGWIAAMVEQAQRPSIGAVGALLLYPDDTVRTPGCHRPGRGGRSQPQALSPRGQRSRQHAQSDQQLLGGDRRLPDDPARGFRAGRGL